MSPRDPQQVLLIEDDDRVADFVEKGLRENGHMVIRADEGRTGLIEAASGQFDLIILDRMLPHVEGMTILQTIRATGDAPTVAVIERRARGRGADVERDDH